MADELVGLSVRLLCGALAISTARAERWLVPLGEAFALAEINTPRRVAHALGQIGHETGRLRYVRELWGPTPAQRRYEPGTTLSKRLGNTEPGDGARYMGRGLIQVTGRFNYGALTRRLRQRIGGHAPDFEAQPQLLEVPRWAALSAADYWMARRLNALADADDVEALTRAINGGLNGLADRQHLYACALVALAREGHGVGSGVGAGVGVNKGGG